MNSTYNNKEQNKENQNEEIHIYNLVNIISSIHKKIYDLQKSMEHTKKNELYQRLSLIEEEIIKKREEINNFNEKKNNKEMNCKKIISLNELNNQIIEMDLGDLTEKIKDMTIDGRNNTKDLYLISNDDIGTILSEKKNIDNLKYINIDFTFLFNKYQNILNDINAYKNKKEQLDEKMNMLNEEKSIIETKIMEYISRKESLEELDKIYLFKFFEGIKNSENQIDNFQAFINNIKMSEENLIIHIYELKGIDIDNLCKEIASQIIFSINNNINNNLNIEHVQNNKKEERKLKDNIDNNSLILAIYSKIKKYILEFMNSFENQNEEDNYNSHILIDNFFNNISKFIINLLDYYMLLSNQISETNFLVIYLKLVFKKYIIENIIKNDSNFLNKEYKKAVDSIKKDLNICFKNIIELNEKEKKYRIKLNSIENKKNDLNRTNNKNILSLKEKKYMNLNEKTNKLIENKNNLNIKLNEQINDYKKDNKNINIEILNKIKSIKNLISQKILIEEKIGKRNKIILLEIKKLKKLCSEKFNEIKDLLDIYKEKHGSNFHLYDKFMDKINKSLSSTSKSLMHKYSRRINNNNYKTPKNKTYSSIYQKEPNNRNLTYQYSNLERRHPSIDYTNRNYKYLNFNYH